MLAWTKETKDETSSHQTNLGVFMNSMPAMMGSIK
jgi:hypothetical protein